MRRLGQVDARLQLDGVEQPRQVTQHRLPEPALGQQPLFPWLERLLRLLVDQAIEQRRLQAILGRRRVSHCQP